MVGDVWRWGMKDAAAHADMDRAWRQLVRWLIADVPLRVQVTAEPVVADANGAMRIQVRVRDEKFQPVDDANVTVAVESIGFEGTPGAAAATTAKGRGWEGGVEESLTTGQTWF